MVVDPVNQ